jgi:hypothetical protein
MRGLSTAQVVLSAGWPVVLLAGHMQRLVALVLWLGSLAIFCSTDAVGRMNASVYLTFSALGF